MPTSAANNGYPAARLLRCLRPAGNAAVAGGEHVVDTVDVGGYPEALAVSADGHRLYVCDYWFGTATVLSIERHPRTVVQRGRPVSDSLTGRDAAARARLRSPG